MNARVLLKIIKLDTTLELSQFTPVDTGMNYKDAIQLLLSRDRLDSKTQSVAKSSGSGSEK